MTTTMNSRDTREGVLGANSSTVSNVLDIGLDGFVTRAADHSAFDFGQVGFVTATPAMALSTAKVAFVPDACTTAAADSGITGGGGGDDLVRLEALRTVEMVFGCGFTVSFIMIGIPGNIFSLLVFGKQGAGDRVNILLISLDVTNLINITTLFISRGACFIKLFEPIDVFSWALVFTPQVVILNRWANFVVGFLMVIMAVDRCISVVFPLKASRILTYRRMLATILTVYLVVFTAYAPMLFLYTGQWTLDPTTNRSMALKSTADHYAMDNDIPVHITMIFGLIIKPASVGIVGICTTITVVKLKQAMKRRHQMTGDDRSQVSQSKTRITKMLIFLSIIYVVLVLPEIAIDVTSQLVPEFFVYRKYHNTFMHVVFVNNAVSALNSSVNFFAYFLLSSKFRATLADMLPCIKPLLKARAYRQHTGKDLQHCNAKTSNVTHSALAIIEV